MQPAKKIVISASRRTDIPAFYLKWFAQQIKKGFFKTTNPYNGHVSITPATPDKVHTIVFWSKNFRPFIKSDFGKNLQKKGYNLFFNFTINSCNSLLEPNVPSLNDRLDQLSYLCDYFNPESINWRFDPVCFYKAGECKTENNMHDFIRIAKFASENGVKRCITSFMDHYVKIKKRAASIQGFSFIEPHYGKKISILLKMERELKTLDIKLFTCCEKELLDKLSGDSSIQASSCIPNDLLVKLYGGELSMRKDTGQRIKQGCGCKISVDIGSYSMHPCYHNCLFCYANPSSKKTISYKNSEVLE
ncbi:MAG: DUF1848 family protein [Deltaproteobacteria bacterium]|nr:DUF1848 family protein [Deltaproteobacteria bacterium]